MIRRLVARLVRTLARSLIGLAFAFSATGLAATGTLIFYLLDRSERNDHRMLHTVTVIAEIERLHLAIVEAESAGRGYLVVGTDPARIAYVQALARIDTRLVAVRAGTADNPVQQEALHELGHLVASRFAYLSGHAALRASEGLDAAVRSARGHGGEEMRAIQDLLRRMSDTEEHLLAVRHAERDRSDALLKQVIAGCLAAGGLILAAVFWQLKRLWRARVRAEAAALRRSHYDALTGLPNARLLGDRLGVALSRARRQHEIVAVFAVDLDGFGSLNERLGRQAGDELLQLVGSRLKGLTGGQDTAARVGGDEFVIVLAGFTDPAHAQRIGARLVATLAEPFTCAGAPVKIGASIGIALYPREAATAEELLRHAQQALQCSKRRGKAGYASVAATAFADMEAAA